MPDSEQEHFITWLKDAHAFESKMLPELKAHAAQAAEHPQVQAMILQHAAETEQHAETVSRLIEQFGGSVSALKTVVGQTVGAAMGASTRLAEDAVVKNAIAEFTFEHTEIASYLSLIAAAEHLHLTEAIEPLRTILRQEEAMADWLRNQIGVVTVHFLHEQDAPVRRVMVATSCAGQMREVPGWRSKSSRGVCGYCPGRLGLR